ncbi:hypothetical protein Tco_0959056 [Tanacetum coccineum]
MLHTCYGHGLTKGTIIQIFYHGLDDPTQRILDAGGMFLYNTPNEAFKILKDKDYTVHIPYTNAKTFADDVLLNHVGGEELKSIDGVGTGRMKKKEKSDNDVPKEPNKEWKMNEKVVPHKENIYHYQWHPTEIPHLNRIIKES